MTEEEAILAMNLMINSLREHANLLPEQYFLVSHEIATHISNYNEKLTGKYQFIYSGLEFEYMGIKCKVA